MKHSLNLPIVSLNVQSILFSAILFSSTAYAQNITSPDNAQNFTIQTESGNKIIRLMKINPTVELNSLGEPTLNSFDLNIRENEFDYSGSITPFSKSAGAVDLGMNQVPVLDQGQHGTCTTFATTAALDARFFGSDYIDQQCSIELDTSLNEVGPKNPRNLTGPQEIENFWNGPVWQPELVILPLKNYGIVAKNNCPGAVYPDSTQIIDSTVYQTVSNKSFSDAMLYSFIQGPDLNAVKAALNTGYRVIIGTSLGGVENDPVSVNGFNIRITGQRRNGGLWACQQPGNLKNYCVPSASGHTVVVIGYDDRQQLLKIRNSWGTGVGDRGNYYMTYNFYNAMDYNNTIIR